MLRLHTLASPTKVVLALLLTGVACAQAEGFTSDRNASGGSGDDTGGSGDSGGASSGGMSSTGGTPSSGGTSATGGTAAGKGGASSSTGGTTTSAKGGATSTGGTTAKGGATSTGGVVAKGGATNTPGSTLLSDDFEDMEAADWYAADMNGTRAVTMQDSGYAYVMTSTDKALSVGGSVTWTDQRLEAKVKFLEAADSPVLYLMARWAEAKSYIVIEFRPGTTSSPQGDMKLRQTDSGSTTDLCRFKPTSVVPDTWYTIGVSLSGGMGSTATLLFDGAPVAACTLTKAGPAAGGVALGIQSGSAAFDDVLVTVPE